MTKRIPGFQPSRSRAVLKNNLAYIVSTPSDTNQSMYTQTKQALAALDADLAALGLGRKNILMTTVYIADMSKKPEMNLAWDEWASRDHPPVRACIGSVLEPGYLVEMVTAACD